MGYVAGSVKPEVIDQNHPSFGCGQAFFLFAVRNLRTGSISKLLLVEAKGAWAVQTMERLLLADGTVSPNCFVLSVHRECGSIGIRAEILDQVSYVDFMLDVVDPGRLIADALISVSFRRSLTEEEREYASRKIEMMNAVKPVIPAESRPSGQTRPTSTNIFQMPIRKPAISTPITPAEPAPVDSVKYHQLTNGLIGLGFKKAEVKKFIDALGDQMENGKLEDLIRKGISELAA